MMCAESPLGVSAISTDRSVSLLCWSLIAITLRSRAQIPRKTAPVDTPAHVRTILSQLNVKRFSTAITAWRLSGPMSGIAVTAHTTTP